MENLEEYLQTEFKKLDRGLVATPKDYNHLESFAKANHGSCDLILMQMAIQYGYYIALEKLQEQLEIS